VEARPASVKLGVPRIDPDGTGADPRILHLLNRFTFGATPQDVAEVRALGKNGIDQWFEQQLHPDRIPASAGDQTLQTQLAGFPALQLPVDELLARFPSGGMIRQTANGKLLLPDDPYLAAIYKRHIELYEDKQAKKADKAEAAKTLDGGKPEASEAERTKPQANQPGASTQPQAEKPGRPSQADMALADAIESATSTSMTAASTPARTPAVTPAMAPAMTPPTAPKKPVAAQASPARPAYADLLVKSVLDLLPGQRVHRILYMKPAEYEQFHENLKGPLRAKLTQDMNPEERELVLAYENPTRTVVEELEAQRLLRDIYSSHQLQEVMTTFWLNHFNVYLHKNDEAPYYLVSYERDIIRPRALGNFEDLLVATAESPAMLLYLDNSQSTGPDSIAAEKQKQRAAMGKAGKATPPGLNENYGRELMELHTLGVNGGYTQQDVTEVAKVFTGWTVDRPQLGGGFKFDETRHEPGKKVVMGHKIKENGQKEGLQLLHILATSPATAHFISQELAVAFVSDNPPPALVDRMAQSFRSSHGEIVSVLRTLIHSPEFWAPSTYQAKVKTPLEYVVSAARASGAEILNTQPLVNALNQMGMPLYGCVPPTGYSDKADAWVSTGELVTRMNFALSLSTNHFGGIKSQWTPANSQVADASVAEKDLEARLIPAGVSEKTRAAVLDQVQPQTQPSPQPQNQVQIFPQPVDDPTMKPKPQNPAAQAKAIENQNAQIAGLLLGSPEFQRR
jgi:uncharacterized protein (DUF1800 family)